MALYKSTLLLLRFFFLFLLTYILQLNFTPICFQCFLHLSCVSLLSYPQYRINDIQSQVHEQNRKRDETTHALDVVQREREHAADNERLKMQGKIAEIAEEVSRKILTKEIRLREEAQQKFGNIEKVTNGYLRYVVLC